MTSPPTVSTGARWAGGIVSAVTVLFSVFDGVTKVIREPHVIEGTARLGFAEGSIVGIGVTLLVCTALYVIPWTSVLGAVLLTGYLGGAVAANVRVGNPAFNTGFPIVFAILVWLGLFLREPRLRVLLPLRA